MTVKDSERTITRRAGIVALGTLLSRLLGLVRDGVLASEFSRAATDAFLVAFQLPNLLRQLLAEGAVQTAVLPVLGKVATESGEEEAKRLYRAIRGLSLLTLTLVSIAGVVFAPELVDLFAPGFKARPEAYESTVTLTRWVFPYLFFMGTAALSVAALNLKGRFVATAFSPALLNVAFIACSFGLPALLALKGYDAVLALACGALLGGVLQMVAQWPSLKAIGYFQSPSLEFSHPGVRQALARLAPSLFGIGVYYIDVIWGRRLLSELGEGPISYFGFALRICDFPQGIFIMALQSATLPSLSLFVAQKDFAALRSTFAFSMRLAFFVGIPATLATMVLAEPIVSVLFERGEFDRISAGETSRALMAQGISIFLVAGIRQLVAVFFALGDTKTPVLVASLDLLVFVFVATWLKGPFGHVGVSLGVSAASLAQFSLLVWFLRRKLGTLEGRSLLSSAAKTTFASGMSSLLVLGYLWVLPSDLSRQMSAWLALLGGGTLFLLSFLTISFALKSQEAQTLRGSLSAKLGLSSRRQGS